MKPSNVRKNKGTTKCDKRIVTYDVGITKCEDETIKCEDLVTWYSRLPTSRYRTPLKRGHGRITHIYIYRKENMNENLYDIYLQCYYSFFIFFYFMESSTTFVLG